MDVHGDKVVLALQNNQEDSGQTGGMSLRAGPQYNLYICGFTWG
jgi:hypothetical protein